jgi:hypothetical protein
MPLFVHDDGRVLGPTGRNIWERLISGRPEIEGSVSSPESAAVYAKVHEQAVQHGRPHYRDVQAALEQRISRERERGEYAFAARRRAVERIGLPEVRNFRLTRLDQEERDWREKITSEARVMPELTAVVMLRVSGAAVNG